MTNPPSARRGRRIRRLLLVPPVCALVLATAACGGSGSASSAGSSSAAMSSGAAAGSGMAATGTTIMIEKFAYAIPPSVSPGARIGVMNMDGEAHTVTADSGNAFDVRATPGETVTFTAPSTPGRYAFHCTYHSNMHGVLVVK